MGEPDWTDVHTVDDGVMLAGYLLTFAQAEALATALNDAARRRWAAEDEQARRSAFRSRCVASVDVGRGIVGIDADGRPKHLGPDWPSKPEWDALDKLGADIGWPVAWMRNSSSLIWHRKGCGCRREQTWMALCRYMPDGVVPAGGTACAATLRKWGVK